MEADKNKAMKATESGNVIERLARSGRPIMIGRYLVGEATSGSRINDKNGKAEGWAGIKHSVIVGRKVVLVKEYPRDNEERTRAITEATGNEVLADKLMPAKEGEPVVVFVSAYKIEKGLVLITGEVAAL